MRTTRTASVALAFLVTACGGGERATDNSSGGNAVGAVAAQEQAPVNRVDPRNQVAPVVLPSPSPVSGIPAAFQGRWGMVSNDCDPRRDDAKGLMTIDGDTLTFYESRGRASAVKATEPSQITANLAFTGEGQHWTEPTRLTLLDAGKTLVREVNNPANAFRYSRCPSREPA